VRVGVVGAAGRMGRQVCEALAATDDLELVAAVDPAVEGADLHSIVGGAVPSIRVAKGHGALSDARAEVVVDFSRADVAVQTLKWCAANGVHAVVGTTGLSEADLAFAAELFDGAACNAVVAPNFAIGAALLVAFCELAAPVMSGVEIIELHHDQKRDAPSGTALYTAQRIHAAREREGSEPLPSDPTKDLGLEGVRGGVAPGGVRIHAVRLPGLIAHQEVVFGAPGQSLSIRHDSYDRSSFMPGVLLAIRAVPGRPGLTIGLGPLLGL